MRIINSLRNIASDPFWVPKMLFYSYLIYLLIINFDYLLVHSDAALYLGIVIGVAFMGSAYIMINRNINNLEPILPRLIDIPQIIWRSIIATIIIIPGCAAYYYTNNWLQPILQAAFEEQAFLIGLINVLVCIFFAPFIFVPVVLYGIKGSIKDALRVDILLRSGGDFMVSAGLYFLQYILIIYVGSLLMYLLLKNMLGDGNLFLEILYAIVITLTFFSTFSYASDLYGEIIPEIKLKRKKKKEYADDQIAPELKTAMKSKKVHKKPKD